MREQIPYSIKLGINHAAIYPDWSLLNRIGNRGLNLYNRPDALNKHSGYISERSRRKLENIIKWFILQAPVKKIRCRETGKTFNFRVNFITLTLPTGYQLHSDVDVKSRFLNQFLIECKRYTGMKNYIWKAEPQKNGAIHFHVTTDAFIHWKMIRETWNRILEKDGYITAYRKEQQERHKNGFNPRADLFKNWPLCKQYHSYIAGKCNNWSSPNTTDVHSVKNIKDMPAYIAKYLTKGDKTRRGISGRIWGTSERLSFVSDLKFDLTGYKIEQDVYNFRKCVKFKTLDHCELLIYNSQELLKKTTGRLKFYIDSVIQYLRGSNKIDRDYIQKIATGEIDLPSKYIKEKHIFENQNLKNDEKKPIREIIYDLLLHDI
jgi:hypothetical protein